MSLNKFKKIVAQMLVVAIMLPNITVGATTNEANNGEVNEQSEVINNTDETQVTEEVQTEDKVEVETEVKPEVETEVKPEGGIETETEVKPEDTDIVEEDNSLDNIEVENNGAEVNTEEVLEGNTENKVEENAVEDAAKKEEINPEEALVGEKYSSKPIIMPRTYAVDEKSEEIEYQLKMEGASTLSLLETKTDSEFEIALAHSDGSYTFVKTIDSLEAGIEAIETMPVPYSAEQIVPVVIARNGQVAYAQNAMARVWKHVDGKPYKPSDKNTKLYSDSSLTSEFTYVNHTYVDDAPILADAGNSAKILVSGYEGWINKNTSASEYDMVVVPINQAVNPSYYFAENGELKHFISSNLTGSGGHTISIGQAPSNFTPGVKYLSYDGIYFYNGSDLQTGLNNLMNDYKRGIRGNAMNAGQPHYTYYKYLPFRSKTVYSAEELNRFIDSNTESHSKLRGIGGALKDSEQKYGVNALLTLGVAINESGWGESAISQSKNNLFGIKAYDSNVNGASSFASSSDSVYEFTKNYISRGYADPEDWRYFGGFLGNKKHGANVKYASDPFWGEKAAQHTFTADKYLSGSVSNLRDTNAHQIAMAGSANKVMNSGGASLYNTNKNNVETPFVVSKKGKVTVAGQSTYEIYSERNTSISTGEYSGSYDWHDKGYVADANVSFLNKAKDMVATQPWVDVKAGIDRYETAVQLSKGQFSKSDTVVIVNGLAIADGLTSTPIAKYHNAPLLLVEKNSVPSYTANEIKRLGAKKAIIVGETGVVSGAVEQQLKNLGINSITRLGGIDRYATSLQVAKYIDGNLYDVSDVFIAAGLGEADAMSIAPVAGRDNMPILLTEKNDIPTDVYNWLSNEGINNAYIIGGAGIITDHVMNRMNAITSQNIMGNRLGGANRAETNAMVISKFYGNTDSVYITKELSLVDALAAGPTAALNGYPIVLAGNDLTGPQKDVLGQRTAGRVVQAGHGVSSKAIQTLRECLTILEY